MKFGPVEAKWLVMPIDRLTGGGPHEVGVPFSCLDEDENEVNDVSDGID